MSVSESTILYVELLLIIDTFLLLYILRPKKPVIYSMQHATRSYNSHRRMFGQEELLGVSNLPGSRWDWNPAYVGPLRYRSRKGINILQVVG